MLHHLLKIDFASFPIYQIMLIAAFVAGWIMYGKMFRKGNFSRFVKRRIRRCFFWGAVFALVASNVVNWLFYPQLMQEPLQLRITQGVYSSFFGLLVFYGVSALLLRMGKMKVRLCLNFVTPAVLLALFIARLGCTLNGCCYGKLLGAGVCFPTTELEAVFALVLCIVLTKKATQKRFWIFGFSYTLLRFVLEFFRGDDRGSLLGITALTPVQLFAIPLWILCTVMLFKEPFCRYFLLEHKLLSRREKRLQRLESKGKKPYEPLPYDYTPAKGRGNPLHPIGVVLLCLVVFFGGLVYLNPFGFRWTQNLQYGLDGIFAGSSHEKQSGQLNGLSVQDASDQGTAKSKNSALEIVTSYDDWTGADLTCTYETTLPSGNRMFGFTQQVDGIGVFGTGRVLVTDSSCNALYVAGDETGLTFTDEVLADYPHAQVTLEDAFGEELVILQTIDCWYDTGAGLVAARQVILSTDGATPAFGAILDLDSGCVLALTGTKPHVYSSFERNRIYRAAEEVAQLIRKEDEVQLEQIRKTETAPSEWEQDVYRLKRALITAYQKSGMTGEEFLTAMESANVIADYTPNLNQNLYLEILASEAHSTMLQAGYSDSQANSGVRKMRSAFSSCDIEQLDDETVTELTGKKRKASFDHSMDGSGDQDVFRLHLPDGQAMEVKLQTRSPIEVEVYTADGRALTNLYVEQEERFCLYPEDGSEFTVVISSGISMNGLSTEAEDYTISLIPIEAERVPISVTSTLYLIEQAYRNSNALAFYALCASDLQAEDDQGALLAAFFVPLLVESCYGCQGGHENVDAAKTMIARELIADELEFSALDYIEDSQLTLTYVSHGENERGIAVKAQMLITLDGVDIFDGYTFFLMEPVDYSSQVEIENEEHQKIFDTLFSSGYSIAQFHTDALYAAFGDTRDNIASRSDLTSLYELQTKYVHQWDDLQFTFLTLDEQAALAMGHSPEKVDGFYNYTLRQNIMNLKQAKTSLKWSLQMAKINLAAWRSLESVVEVAEFAFDLYTDPGGKILEMAAEATNLDGLYTAYSWITSFDDQIEDAIKDSFKDAFFDSMVDPYIVRYEERCLILTYRIELLEKCIEELEQSRRS